MAKRSSSKQALLPKELTTITPLSRTLAFIAFLTIPIIAFYMGRNYQTAFSPCMSDNSLVPVEKIVPITPVHGMMYGK